MSIQRGSPPNRPAHPIESLFQHRWSPYRFDARDVEDAKLLSCLEAARWAPSSFNEQPWRWILAARGDHEAFDQMLGCLIEANRVWARDAGVLILSVIRTHFQNNGKPNRVAMHDLGLAAAHLTLQATALGLQVHQMAGVNLSRIRAVYDIPEGFEPQTALALGYPASDDPATDTERELEQRQSGPRTRRPLSDQVDAGAFGRAAPLVSGD